MMHLGLETECSEVEGLLKPQPVLWFSGCQH